MSALKRSFTGLTALLIALATAAGAVACSSDSDDNSADPLATANSVHCDFSADHACIEYDRVTSGGVRAFVALDEARSICAAGWPGGHGEPGTFAEGSCSTDLTVARCRVDRGYVELDYFYEDFGGATSADDPLPPLQDLCERSSGTLETPPF